ncbi:MAG: hypothetical protein Q4G43_06640 [Mobilicoccus sp.]|nr:hypothetical protein [Mobilicoccus sp.]
MGGVSKRDLNQHTAAVLDQVSAEKDVVVTERGVPRWRISAFRSRDDVLVRLAREGRYTPPTREPAPWPDHPGGPSYTGEQVDALIDEMRGDH